jgi:hypothetical protein
MVTIHGVAMQQNPKLMTYGRLPQHKQVHTRIGETCRVNVIAIVGDFVKPLQFLVFGI